MQAVPEALNFLNEAYNHCKTIAASGAGVGLLAQAGLPVSVSEEDSENGSAAEASMDPGVIVSSDGDIRTLAENFILGIARHRHWERELQLSDVSSQMPKAPPASKRARV